MFGIKGNKITCTDTQRYIPFNIIICFINIHKINSVMGNYLSSEIYSYDENDVLNKMKNLFKLNSHG